VAEEMTITEIVPGKKYVVVMPGARTATALKFQQRLKRLLESLEGGVVVVSGTELAIVPADQVVGYTVLEPEEA
jgi:hypothetical protein